MPPTRDIAVRRRRAALLALAGASAVVGAAMGASAEPQGTNQRAAPVAAAPSAPSAPAAEAPPREAGSAVARLTPTQQAGLLVVLRYAGTSPPAYVTRALRRGWATGAILFRDNVVSPAQVRGVTARLRRAAGTRTPLICVDQEGGAIRILRFAAPESAPPSLGSAGAAAAAGRAAARDLRRAGVTVNLAPVADVVTVPGSVMRGRAFPGGAGAVAGAIRASVRAYRQTGVLPTLKHFPGLGGSRFNTDLRPVTISERPPLAAFAAGIEAGVPLVMLSHAVYPALDPGTLASQSPAIVTGLLRGRLGFRGVAMTDSIEARAVVTGMSVERAAVRSVRAGVDVILTTGRGSHLRVLRALTAEARRDPRFRAALQRSAARVLALRRNLSKQW